MAKLLLSICEAAELVGVGRDTAYEFVKSGVWPSVPVGAGGRVRRVPRAFLLQQYGIPPQEPLIPADEEVANA